MRIALITGLASLTLSSRAHAETPDRSASYLGDLVLADLAWVAVGAVGAATRTPALGYAAGVGMVASGPLVHLTQGEGGHAAWSVGLRLTLPIAMGAIGYAASGSGCDGEHEEEQCRLSEGAVGALVGAGIGAAGALVLDYALHSRRTPRDAAGWTPMVTARENGATLGVSGRF